MDLIAEMSFRYAQRSLKPGDRFTAASERDAFILKAAKRAKDAEPAEQKRGRRYNRRDMAAATES